MTLICKECGEAFSAPASTDFNVDALVQHLSDRHSGARDTALRIADVVVAMYVTSLFLCDDVLYLAIRRALLESLNAAIEGVIKDDLVAIQGS